MNTSDFQQTLRSGCFCLRLKGNTKEEVLAEMIDLLVAAGKLRDREKALQAVMEREARMSTGIQHGVAVPHGKTDAVDGLVTVFALKPEGVDFQSLDGEPSRIFVLTLSPLNRTGPHIQYLSEISRFLNRPEIRERLLEAQTVQEILDILS